MNKHNHGDIAVGIVGASGYGGAELVRLLEHHPAMRITALTGGTQAGQALQDIYPHTGGTPLGEMPVTETSVEAVAGCDVVFLATPHGIAAQLGAPLAANGTKVVDLSGAHRLTPSEFETWYGEPHPHPEATPAVYGLPELYRDRIATTSLVAGPGCYPTATLLGVAPFISVIDASTISIAGMSGISGAGRGLKPSMHFCHTSGNTVAYGAPSHRHTIEIEHVLTDLFRGVHNPTSNGTMPTPPVSFTPHTVPMVRGMIVSTTVRLLPNAGPLNPEAVLREHYANEPLVHVTSAFPETTNVVGSAMAHVTAKYDPRTNGLVISTAIDNMVKGAAGQAIQVANILMGLPEITGLPRISTYL